MVAVLSQRRVLFLLLALVGAAFCSSVSAQGREPSPGVYLPPNEQHPAVALPLFVQSNHGTYVSVGTERSFIGAALTNAQALMVIDYDPEVIRFASINRALLAAGTGREDYLNLRLHAGPEIWRERATALSPPDRATLADPRSWDFWEKAVRNNTGAWSSAFEHFHTPPKKPDDAFADADYLFDDVLYLRLRKLARDSHIWARVLDLRHEPEVRALCADLKAKGLKPGVIDTSNVPDASEAGSAAAGQYIHWFSSCSDDDTLFLNTERANRASVSYWSYYAFTNKVLKTHDAATISRWLEIEIKNLKTDPETRALLNDPAAVEH
jgi:hypothetical protein